MKNKKISEHFEWTDWIFAEPGAEPPYYTVISATPNGWETRIEKNPKYKGIMENTSINDE